MKKLQIIILLMASLYVSAQNKLYVNSSEHEPSEYLVTDLNKITFNKNGINLDFKEENPQTFSFKDVDYLSFKPASVPTGTDDIKTGDSSIKLYPIPVESTLTINYVATKNENVEIRIVNMNGTVVHTSYQNAYPGKMKAEVDVANLKTGVYTVIINNNDFSAKFIKK